MSSASVNPTARRRRGLPTAAGRPDQQWVWLVGIALTIGLAAIALALADTASRQGHGWAQPLYWAALVLLFAPASARLLMPSPQRYERVVLLVMLALGLYAVKVLTSPAAFTFTDELQQLRGLADVERTHHLFTPNPLVAAYPFFPAMVAITSAVNQLTGLGAFTSGLIVIGAARLMWVLALFALFERVSGSSRLAAVATVVTMTNPNFTYFEADWAYESLALPMAIVALLGVSRIPELRSRLRKGISSDWPAVAIALALSLAVIVTHHMSTAWLVTMLLGWAVAMLVRRRSAIGPAHVPLVALVVSLAAAAWYWFVARNAIADELGPTASSSISALGALIHGSTGGKQVFHAASGAASPPAEQLFGFAAVAIALTLLGVGLAALWVRKRKVPRLGFVLAGLAALYVPSLVLRLTQAGTETANRASEFVFIGIGFLAALAMSTSLALPGRVGRVLEGARAWPVLWVACIVLFVGGITIGWAPYDRQPGRYEVSADSRSIDRQGVAAAKWAGAWLPRNSLFTGDVTNRLLMYSYGHLNPQSGSIDGDSVPNLFLSTKFGPEQLTIIKGDKIRYVVADQRLTELVSQTGFPVRGGRRPKFNRSRPLPTRRWRKFEAVHGLDRVFDSGAIRIYDAEALLS